MRCTVCGARRAPFVVRDEGGARAFCADHAPAMRGDDETRAGAIEAALARGGERTAGRLFDLALARLRAGRPAEAEALVLEVLRTEPRRAAALALLARVRERRGDAAGALEAARLAVAAAPRDSGAHATLGRHLAIAGDLDGARAAFLAGFEADPLDFECGRRAAALLLAARRPAEALALARRYLEHARVHGADAIPTAGAPPPATAADFPSALDFIEAEIAARITPRLDVSVARGRFEAHLLAGDALLALERRPEAARHYADAVALAAAPGPARAADEEDARAHVRLAALELEAGRAGDALPLLETARARDQDDADACCLLALACRALGRDADAARALADYERLAGIAGVEPSTGAGDGV